jgi:hypothetical protein
MNYPQQSCEISGIQNTVVRSQNFFEDILIPLLDSEFWILTPKQSFEEFF